MVKQKRHVKGNEPEAKLATLAQKYCSLMEYTKKLEIAYENTLKRRRWSDTHYANRKRARAAGHNVVD